MLVRSRAVWDFRAPTGVGSDAGHHITKGFSTQPRHSAVSQVAVLNDNHHYTNVSGDGTFSGLCSPRAVGSICELRSCADGTYSFSQHHQGTCSHYGGVSQWLK